MKTSDLVVKPVKKVVEDWLNEVNYADDYKYIPKEFALKFVNFIKLVNGGKGEENTSPVLHYKMLDGLDSPYGYLANLVYRGAAKTTLMGEYLFLYLATYGELPHLGKVNLAIYISDSVENGVRNMRKNLEHRWSESEFLQTFVPKIKFTDIRWEFENVDGQKLIVKGYGSKTGIRGAKELGVRPQFALMDDLVSDEDARSPTVIASIEDTVNKAINYALHPTKRKVVWNGTPFNQNDPLYKAVESGAWLVNVFPVCEHFPCSREEFHGAWEDRFPYEFVKTQYDRAVQEGRASDFNQELMLRIISDEERSIKESDIGWYSRSRLLQNKDSFNWFITSDFAVSEKQRADDSGISVWAVNHNFDIFWVDGILKRHLMDKNFDEMFRLVQQYRPIATGIETNGQQKGFISLIQREMMNRGVFFNLASDRKSGEPGIRSSQGQKFTRFNSYAVPLFKAHKFYFPEEMREDDIMKEAINQLTLVTPAGFKSKKDDFLDTISQLGEMTLYAPSDSINVIGDKSGLWDDDDNDDQDSLNSYMV